MGTGGGGGGRTNGFAANNNTFGDLERHFRDIVDGDFWRLPADERRRMARLGAVRSVLEGHRDLAEAREHWAELPVGSVAYTAAGLQFNRRTATDAIRVASEEFGVGEWLP